MDRSILEGNPIGVIEGMMIAGYAIGAQNGYFYVRAEYPIAVNRLKIAIKQAEEAGLLGDNILLVGNQLVSHCAGAFGRGQPFRLHRLHLASAQRTVLRGIVAHLRCLHAVCGEARLEGAVAHRADDKSTATLHLVAARILHRESRRHDDATKAVVFGLGNVQRGTVGNLVAVLVNKLQGEITLCLNSEGC